MNDNTSSSEQEPGKTRAPVKSGRKDWLPGLDETKVVDHLKKPQDLLSGAWLRQMSDQELVLTVMSLVLELQSRVGKPVQATGTDALNVEPHPFAADKDALKAATEEFVELPTDSTKRKGDPVWRFILISANSAHKPLALEIHDEIVVGRRAEKGEPPDLDLAVYGGAALGVSRRHALLRPNKTSLLLIDEQSTNGTFCNQEKLAAVTPKALEDGDTVSFGSLHFKIMFVSQPGKPDA